MDIFSIMAAKKISGDGGSLEQVQSNWDTNDSADRSYIQNRPFYTAETMVTDFVFPTATELYYTEEVTDDAERGYAALGYKLELTPGETYTLEEIVTGDSTGTETTEGILTAYRASVVSPELGELGEDWDNVIVLVDEVRRPIIIAGALGRDFSDISNVHIADDTMYYTYIPLFTELSYTSILKNYNGIQKTYKKIPRAYLPDDIGSSYVLPVATSDTLGGVKPVLKNNQMTQLVGVDSNGLLFTMPDAFTSVSVTYSTGSSIRHPVYKNEENHLFARVLPATTSSIGGVKVGGTTTLTRLSCFISGDVIYATHPTVATTVVSGSSQLVSSDAVYQFLTEAFEEAAY